MKKDDIIINTSTYMNYIKTKKLPGIDELLEQRKNLVELRDNESTIEYSRFYDNEIKAVEYLLGLHN